MDSIPPALSSAPARPPRGLLVVPVYKPAPEWETFLPALVQAVAASGLPIFVRVVGDGNQPEMRDRVDRAVAGVRERWPHLLRPTRHREGNVGKGASVYFGWEGAEEEWLGFVDSDGSVSPEEVLRLARLALALPPPGAVVLASRRPEPGRVVRRRRARRLLGAAYSALVRLGLGIDILDTQCGLKWVPAAAFADVKASLRESRFVFDVELLGRLRARGLPLREEPISWATSSFSTLRFWRDGPAMLWGLLRVVLRLRFGR